MMYAVTRQSNYYDEGAYSVEIARQWDFISPGALVERYPGEFCEYDDPREAAEAAISIAVSWRTDAHTLVCYTIAGNSWVYPTTADGMNARELRAWARAEWDALPKCDHCGEPGELEWRHADDFAWDDSPRFCSENCAEMDSERDRAEMEEAFSDAPGS